MPTPLVAGRPAACPPEECGQGAHAARSGQQEAIAPRTWAPRRDVLASDAPASSAGEATWGNPVIRWHGRQGWNAVLQGCYLLGQLLVHHHVRHERRVALL